MTAPRTRGPEPDFMAAVRAATGHLDTVAAAAEQRRRADAVAAAARAELEAAVRDAVAAGVSQSDAARAAGMSQPWVAGIVGPRRKNPPDAETPGGPTE